jgi:hypothetical protein
MHQRLRRQHQHDHGGDRQRPEGYRTTVDQDRDQHHRRHEERTLAGDVTAGQQQIEGGGGKGCGRRPFLDRKADRQRRKQRQQRADRKEHHAGHHRHVISRHVSIENNPQYNQPVKCSLLPIYLAWEANGIE